MKLNRRVCILVLLLALVVPVAASASSSGSLVVTIDRPDGSCHLNLSVESDGPLWLPVDSRQLDAVQFATEVAKDAVIVSIQAVRDELAVEAVGSYELKLGAEPVELYELEPYGLGGWSLGLVLENSAQAEACTGGCGCGGLCCYPAPGRCISCSSCGSCCAAPAVLEEGD